MAGSLMFVMYGDPESKDAKAPTLSVRTVKSGHESPHLIAQSSGTGGVQVQMLNSSWHHSADGSEFIAEATAVCYDCAKWSGSAFSVEGTSQPWIWAFNNKQDLSPYAPDTQLNMHSLNGGFGSFYVDMSSAETHHLALPQLDMEGGNVGTSNSKITKEKPGLLETLASRPLATLHGLHMATAFLALFPLGAGMIRSESPLAFKSHWIFQVIAIFVALTGAVAGVVMSKGAIFASVHQIVGTIISSLLVAQAILGWRHHMIFMRLRRRTWVSYGHISLGWIIMIGGWGNILSGLVLYGAGKFGITVAALIVAVEVVSLGGWILYARRRDGRKGGNKNESDNAPKWDDGAASYFALDVVDSDDESDTLSDGQPEEEARLTGKGRS